MPAIVGTPVVVQDSSTPVSVSVTVPTGALGVVAFWAFDRGTNGSTLSTISLTGSGAFTILQNVPTVAASFERCGGVAVANVTSTGSQTLDITLPGPPTQGAQYALVFVDENVTGIVRASGGANTASTDPLSVTVTTGSGDLVIALDASYNAVPGTASGWTSQSSGGVYNGQGYRVSTANSPGSSSTTFDAQNESWSVAVVVALTGSDTTPPTLTSATGTGGNNVCSGTVSTDEGNGTLYAVATASATQPSIAQIKAGQDHTGAAALRAVSQSVTTTGTQTISSGAISGGAGTRYWHFLHTDAAANDSNRLSSSGFSVTSGGGPLGVTLDAITDETGSVRASYVVDKIWAIRISDNTLVATWTSQTTNGSGVLPALTNAALTAVPHAFVTYTATGLKAGAKVYTPA